MSKPKLKEIIFLLSLFQKREIWFFKIWHRPSHFFHSINTFVWLNQSKLNLGSIFTLPVVNMYNIDFSLLYD